MSAKKSTASVRKTKPTGRSSAKATQKVTAVKKKSAAPVKKTAPATKKSAKVVKAKKPAEKKSKLVEIKTKPTTVSVTDYIRTIPGEQKQKDSLEIMQMMQKATGEDPVLWGSAIIGFGNIRYKSPNTGREVDWLRIGFAPRKANISLYLTMDINAYGNELKRLGKHKTGKGCLYINTLEDIDRKVLKELIDISLKKR
jgi:hypothetical protein